jgi:hypothetical protein
LIEEGPIELGEALEKVEAKFKRNDILSKSKTMSVFWMWHINK